jgi:hypothetical protein
MSMASRARRPPEPPAAGQRSLEHRRIRWHFELLLADRRRHAANVDASTRERRRKRSRGHSSPFEPIPHASTRDSLLAGRTRNASTRDSLPLGRTRNASTRDALPPWPSWNASSRNALFAGRTWNAARNDSLPHGRTRHASSRNALPPGRTGTPPRASRCRSNPVAGVRTSTRRLCSNPTRLPRQLVDSGSAQHVLPVNSLTLVPTGTPLESSRWECMSYNIGRVGNFCRFGNFCHFCQLRNRQKLPTFAPAGLGLPPQGPGGGGRVVHLVIGWRTRPGNARRRLAG